jgi:NDP-sugar pyrophosphorylase family protein
MNIVIPMAGIGSRFADAGYSIPKPLIDINGEPMIVKAIKSLNLPGKYHFVVRKDAYTSKLKSVVHSILPNAEFVEIDYVTAGPASSVLLFKDKIDNNEELVVANCDQVMWWNSDLFLHNARYNSGTIVTYFSETPKNSYAKLDRSGYVVEVKEKKVISNISLNGIHYWKQGRDFVSSAEEMIRLKDTAPNGEYYVGPTYNYLINRGVSVGVYHIPNEQHHAVGTPEDLAKFVELENSK